MIIECPILSSPKEWNTPQRQSGRWFTCGLGQRIQAEVIKIYAEVKEGDRLGYRYNYTNLPLVKDKLYKAGIRLAAVLNDLFG